jgi:hypothetical protein
VKGRDSLTQAHEDAIKWIFKNFGVGGFHLLNLRVTSKVGNLLHQKCDHQVPKNFVFITVEQMGCYRGVGLTVGWLTASDKRTDERQ